MAKSKATTTANLGFEDKLWAAAERDNKVLKGVLLKDYDCRSWLW